MKLPRAAVALLCTLLIALVLVACGTTQPAGDVNAGFQASTHTNQKYGYSIEYPSGFARIEVPPDGEDPKAPLSDVFFADPKGTQIDDKAVDTLEVAVYSMSAAPTAADFKQHKKDFEAMLAVLIGTLPSYQVAEPLAWTTVAGRPALTETYTYQISGKDVAASAELVFRDAQAYLVRAQAARVVWQTTGRELVSCMAAFVFL